MNIDYEWSTSIKKNDDKKSRKTPENFVVVCHAYTAFVLTCTYSKFASYRYITYTYRVHNKIMYVNVQSNVRQCFFFFWFLVVVCGRKAIKSFFHNFASCFVHFGICVRLLNRSFGWCGWCLTIFIFMMFSTKI